MCNIKNTSGTSMYGKQLRKGQASKCVVHGYDIKFSAVQNTI